MTKYSTLFAVSDTGSAKDIKVIEYQISQEDFDREKDLEILEVMGYYSIIAIGFDTEERAEEWVSAFLEST
jgi:hypothetical protein